MAIRAITPDGVIRWTCMGGEADDHCLSHLSAHTSETVYQIPEHHASQEIIIRAEPYTPARLIESGRRLPAHPQGRGAVIALPPCPECGAQCSLKADYTIGELFRATLTLTDSTGGIIGYALKLPHVYNLLAHHWLHRNGLAEHAPILPLPGEAERNDPRLARLTAEAVMALWFGYLIVQQRDKRLTCFDLVVQELAMLPPGEERRLLDAFSDS